MNRHTTLLLGTALAVGALLLVGVTAAFAGNESGGTFFSRIMGGPGPGGMMNGSGHSGMMNGNHGPDMMSGSWASGSMGRYGRGGMMDGWDRADPPGKAMSIDQARQNVQSYIDQIGNKNLAIDEVIEFQRNFYAVIKDTSTGHGAMEVLVNKRTGTVFPEHGPAMMWNTQYGMMTGGMGQMMGYQRPAGPMTVPTERAAAIARQWLEKNRPGATAESPDQFPGYYTIHFRESGKIAGMLSVNGYAGQVWYHTWHGKAIRVLEVSG